jgi:hypothetical protein
MIEYFLFDKAKGRNLVEENTKTSRNLSTEKYKTQNNAKGLIPES